MVKIPDVAGGDWLGHFRRKVLWSVGLFFFIFNVIEISSSSLCRNLLDDVWSVCSSVIMSSFHHRVCLPRRFFRNLQRRKHLIRFTHFVDVLLQTHPCNQHKGSVSFLFLFLWIESLCRLLSKILFGLWDWLCLSQIDGGSGSLKSRGTDYDDEQSIFRQLWLQFWWSNPTKVIPLLCLIWWFKVFLLCLELEVWVDFGFDID